jgi:hypothetical protein
MKVIFLDVDGVLNNFNLLSRYGFDYIDEGCVSLLANVVRATGARIVLSSSWRLEDKNRSIVKSTLRASKLEIDDQTPYLQGRARIEEISLWLKDHPDVNKFVILDDDEDAGFGMDGFFQTNPEIGLTGDMAEKIVIYLGLA